MSANFRTSTGDVITFELEGVEQVQAELNTLAADLKEQAEFEMCSRVGESVEFWMRQNILAQGLLKSGTLFRSVFSTIMSNEEGTFVFVGPNTEEVPYAMIQEFGGVVPAHYVAPLGRPFGANALHWQEIGADFFSKGHMVGVKKPIVITAKPYIAPAFENHQQEILDIMTQVLNEAIAEEIARSGAW